MGSRSGPDGDNTRGQKRNIRSIYGQKQDHGIRCGPPHRVQSVQFLHGANTKGGGGIAQPQGVCGHIQDHTPHGGMIRGHRGKQPHH